VDINHYELRWDAFFSVSFPMRYDSIFVVSNCRAHHDDIQDWPSIRSDHLDSENNVRGDLAIASEMRLCTARAESPIGNRSLTHDFFEGFRHRHDLR
jgi:hypothetical protein